MSWTQRIDQYLAEGRPVCGGKGDKTAKDAEKSQAAFTQTLQKAFSQQFANQQGVLNFLKGKLEPGINNPQGLSPQALAAERSQAINQNAGDIQSAVKAEQANAAAHGGNGLPSGVQEQIQGQIAGQGAVEKSSALNNITMQNENLKQQNYWNSVNALNGVSAQINPLGYAGNATGAANSVGDLSQAYTASQKTGFWNTLGNSFAGGLGSGLGSALSGGIYSPPSN